MLRSTNWSHSEGRPIPAIHTFPTHSPHSSVIFKPLKKLLLTLFCGYGPALLCQDNAYIPAHRGIELINLDYIVDFDAVRQLPFWVAYELSPEETRGEARRNSSFKQDPRLKNGPVHANYTHSGFDRGHMKPAADSKSSQKRMDASFLMSNVAPQTPALNRGSWKQLEASVRTWAEAYGAIHVVCGPGGGSLGKLSQGHVDIPDTFWKAILRTSPDTVCAAYLIPNLKEGIGPFFAHRLAVDSLESIIGLDLFPDLPDDLEQRIESSTSSFW